MDSLVKRIPLHPNCITLLGLLFAFCASFFLSQGERFAAFVFLLLMAGCDLLDGALARATRRASPFGAFFDSTLDRLSEGLVFLGILLFFSRRADTKGVVLSATALIGSYLVSYARARGENLIESLKAGFWERPERLTLLMLAVVTGRLTSALWVIGIGSFLTAFHRLFYLWATVQKRKLPKSGPWVFLFWPYPRYSAPYWLYALAVILLTVLIPT